MIRRLTICALSLLVALALGWSVLRDREEDSVPAPIVTAHSEDAKPRLDELAEAKTPTERSVSNGTTDSVPDSAEFVTVEVRDRETRTLVPNADVWSVAIAPKGALDRAPFDDMGIDLSELARERGAHQHASFRGTVLLDRRTSRWLVFATDGTRKGFGIVEVERPSTRKVLVDESDDLVVRVRDPARAPVEVGIAIKDHEGRHVILRTRTSSGGEVVLHGLRARLAAMRASDGPFPVCVQVVSRNPVERWIDPLSWPSDAIEFVLPACGSLRVVTVGEGGALVPITAKASVELMTRDALIGRHVPSLLEEALVDGVAKFEHVALGGRLQIDLTTRDDSFRTSIEGPTTDREDIEVRVDVSNGCSALRMRLVDEKGSALVRRRWIVGPCEVALDGSSFWNGVLETRTTDAEGWLVVESTRTGVDELEFVRPFLWLREDTPGDQVRATEVATPRDWKVMHALGDVVVPIARPLVRGRVVDGAGEGVRDQVVTLGSRDSHGEISSFSDGLAARTDERGQFAVFAPCPGHFATLSVEDWNEATVVVPFACDTGRPLEILVHGFGDVEGSFLVDDEAEVAVDLGLELDGASVPPESLSAGTFELAPRADGTRRVGFVARYVPTGAGSFVVRDPATGAPLARVEGVRVRSRRTSTDPRLVDLDLRGKLATREDDDSRMSIDLVIVDQHGTRIPTGTVKALIAGGDATEVRFVDGRASGAVSRADKLAIHAPGKSWKQIAAPFTDRTVELSDTPRLVFALALPSDLESPGVTWSVQILVNESSVQVTNGTGPIVLTEVELDERREGSVVFEIGVPIRFHVRMRLAGSPSWLEVGDCDPRTFDPNAGGASHRVEARLAPAQEKVVRGWMRTAEQRK